MKIRCLGCMEEFDDSYGLCPYCGYDPESEVESPIHMRPGAMLHGRYMVGKVLGFGGFGVTYIGWDFVLQQKVAIKEYLPSEFATRMIGHTQVSVFGGNKEEQFDDGMEQFIEEARRLAQFQNEDGIVRIYDTFDENNTAYIIMEYLEGQTLTAFLEKRGKLSVDEAVKLLTPVLKSLEVVHKGGIIHRDIAPDNIFLTKEGKVKLIDFGAARYATTSHSRSLTVIVKPGYSPEEQYRTKGNQGPHTDVYALGAVIYKMITGIVLPDSMERRAFFESSGKDIIVPVSKNCDVTKNQETAIMNALNIRPEERTPTAAKFLEELTTTKPVKRLVGTIKKTPKNQWPSWAKIFVPTAAAIVVCLFALFTTGVIGPQSNLAKDMMLKDNEARVPGIVNYSVDMAQSMLDTEELKCQIIGAEYSDVIPAGVVLYQSITAGQVVEKESVVDVSVSVDKVSVGTEPGFMPYIIYKTETEATALLESMGLVVSVKGVHDDLVAEGLVVSQSLDFGNAVQAGDEVIISVSGGEDKNRQEATETVIVLSRENYDLYVGDIVNIQAEGGNGKFDYSSSDDKVVKVSRDGEVTAVGKGTAIITVTGGNAEAASCTVTVKDYEMKITPGGLTLFVDSSAGLKVTGIPDADNINWSSADKSIASVNENGKVTGKKLGKTTITATWEKDGRTYEAKASVEVKSQGITLSTYKISSFYVGETRTITAKTSSSAKVTWKSSNANVAKVDSNGKVTAVGGGKATITATVGSFSEKCEVTVIQPSISLTKSSVTLYKGGSQSLSAAVTPSGLKVSWSSSDTGVATVSNGKVTAVGKGSTTITAKMTYAGKTYKATCTVKVSNPSIKLSAGNLTLSPGESKKLTATTTPEGASVTWKSSNTGVATVSGGTVKAVSFGSSTITAQFTLEGQIYKATCNVTVEKPSISVTSSASTIEYSEKDKDTCTLTAAVNPDGGTVKWTISDTSVATISGNGKKATVTAKSAGSATVTATYTVNGETLKDTCTIKVEKAASTLRLENISYPEGGTTDSFRIQGKAKSNYSILRMECEGTATSNALNIPINIDCDPLYVGEGVFEYDLSDATAYFINQYKSLYNTYKTLAGALGADDSVTMRVTGTIYDSSGKSQTFSLTYIIRGE